MEKQNWDLINKKNSIGPALGMAMGKAIDMIIATGGKDLTRTTVDVRKKAILAWRDWIYEENNKKQEELLAELPNENGEKEKEFVDTKQKDIFK